MANGGLFYTPEMVARMTASDAEAWIESAADPVTRDQRAAIARSARPIRNANFLTLTQMKLAPMIAVGSNAQGKAPFRMSDTIEFNFPNQTIGVAETVILLFTVQFTYTPAGGSPTIALNAGGAYNFFRDIVVRYGSGEMHRAHPWFYAIVDGMLRGYNRTSGDRLFTGANAVPGLQNVLRNGLTVNSGVNTWKFGIRIDLNPLSDDVLAGLLPINGSNSGTVSIRTNPTITGNDPLEHVIKTNGTIALDTANSTIEATVLYRNGETKTQLQPFALPSFNGEPTYVTRTEADFSITTAQQFSSQQITNVGQHYFVIGAVVDGLQSDRLSTVDYGLGTGNIKGWRLTKDQAGLDAFEQYGFPSLLPAYASGWEFRRQFGQDLEEGLFPWVYATGQNVNNASNRNGRACLNMDESENAWRAVYHQYYLNAFGSIGVNGIRPRIVCWEGTVVPAGLSVIGRM